MAPDQLLNTLLQYYQDVHDAPKTDQIFGTTAHLLTQLTNPLNIALLTSQSLTATAIWQTATQSQSQSQSQSKDHKQSQSQSQSIDGLRTALRFLSVYNSAARATRERAAENYDKSLIFSSTQNAATSGCDAREGTGCDAWTRAVIKGLDEYSKRWQHLLVLTGVLVGMEGSGSGSSGVGSCESPALPCHTRRMLEDAVVTSANLAMATHSADGPLAGAAIVLALNYAFPLLSDCFRAQLDCNRLLPLAVWAMTGPEGFDDARFLDAIDRDLKERRKVFAWSAQSSSFRALQDLERQPLMGNMGPLSKLAAFAVQQATVTRIVLEAQDALLLLTRRVADAWQHNRLSGIDPAFESHRLHADSLQDTVPLLWRVLQKLLFAVVATLQAVVARSLLDPHMLHQAVAPVVATKSLLALRNLHFVSSRNGNNTFQVYTFTYLTSIDVLGRFPPAVESLLTKTRPCDEIPARHICRSLDLFYIGLSEHFSLALPTEACESLIVKPAINYLAHAGAMTPSLVELFESSHSAILSVLSCPQHSSLTVRITPFYIVKLLESFPERISPRQFRLAFKTVMQIVSPPCPIAAMEPQLSETLLEMLVNAISKASTDPLPPSPEVTSQNHANTSNHNNHNNHPTEQQHVPEPFSAQSALTMALVDALPFLPRPLMSEWLTTTAKTLNTIADVKLRAPVKQRFWDILINGEMDVERAAMGVSWWGTEGGRQLVLYGSGGPGGDPDAAAAGLTMSGALVGDDKIRSRL